MAKHSYKGQLIGIEGRIQTGSYEKDGVRVYTFDVVCDTVQFLEWRGNEVEPLGETKDDWQRKNVTEEDVPF